MNITFYGTGYVGLVTGTCFAELGHHVVCIDINAAKIAQLKAGEVPIYEPKLTALVQKNQASKRLAFSTDAAYGVKHGLCQFITVDTPTQANGCADISNVISVAKTIAQHMDDYRLIINKSTAPVGICQTIRQTITTQLTQRQLELAFDVASNPEFLKEGSAVQDFMQPDRIILGTDTKQALQLLQALYLPLKLAPEKLIHMDIASAELSKYAANAMLATKVSFINEIANLAEKLGADIKNIRTGISTDPRIGPHFIAPGCGYGGSCFPKDVRALASMAKQAGITPHILQAVETVNQQQKQILFTKINAYFKQDLTNKRFAVWGLAFKPNTDDMREASSRVLLESLWQKGVCVQAYDPIAMPTAAKIYGARADFSLCSSKEACLENADALVIVTEWDAFKTADLAVIKAKLNQAVIFDGRNIIDPLLAQENGFAYFGVGCTI